MLPEQRLLRASSAACASETGCDRRRDAAAGPGSVSVPDQVWC